MHGPLIVKFVNVKQLSLYTSTLLLCPHGLLYDDLYLCLLQYVSFVLTVEQLVFWRLPFRLRVSLAIFIVLTLIRSVRM